MQTRKANGYDAATYQYWKTQIDAADKYRDKFNSKGEKIVRRFRDENRLDSLRLYNILYSNTETLQPVIYSDKPVPYAKARDTKNIAARKGGEMIENALSYYISCGDFNGKARLATTDFLLPGLGTIRPKYKPIIQEIEEEIPITDVLDGEGVTERDGRFFRIREEVAYEEIDFEYIYWKDYVFPYAGVWDDLPWQGVRTYWTQEEAEEAVGVEKAALLNYEPFKPNDDATDLEDLKATGIRKAKVYEIWDKKYKQQIIWSETLSLSPLEINDDPLGLEGFFPFPKPMLSITTSGTLLPVPFFSMYQDQALELDDINNRIAKMISYMRKRGFYDASVDELTNINSMTDNEYWPIKKWNEFAGKGGLKGVMDTEDITPYVSALEVLYAKRQSLLDDIYQIIGISDIRRGQSDPRETLGAQKMKGHYGTIRISTYQRIVSEFFRDLLRIAGEIIINQFEPETLSVITNMPLETKTEKDAQGNIAKVIQVGTKDLLQSLRTKSPSDIIIDIETDSTILEDSDGDKQELLNLTEALAQFTQIAPNMTEVVGLEATAGILSSIIQKFKLGRDVQQAVDDHVEELKKKAEAAENQPPQKSPEEMIAEAELTKKRMEIDFERQKLFVESELKKAELGIKQQANLLKAQELNIYSEIENQKIDLGALDGFIRMHEIKVEAANPRDNAVVGA